MSEAKEHLRSLERAVRGLRERWVDIAWADERSLVDIYPDVDIRARALRMCAEDLASVLALLTSFRGVLAREWEGVDDDHHPYSKSQNLLGGDDD